MVFNGLPGGLTQGEVDGTWILDVFFCFSGQISSRPHTSFHPKWWFSKEFSLISETSRLVKYYNLARISTTMSHQKPI